MALPKLNDSPKYELVIPSTKQTVRFRPYLVKEEKVLMLAFESKNPKQALSAVVDTIAACVDGQIDTSKLKIFDVEYMFTQIRAKSVGESSKIKIKCEECETLNPVEVHLDTVGVEVPEVKNIIELTPEVSVKLAWPNYLGLGELADNQNATEQSFAMVINCIEAIMTDEEQFLAKDQSRAELMDFIESLSSTQFAKIKDFIQEMPRMKKDVHFDCENCGHHNKYTLEGMQDFF